MKNYLATCKYDFTSDNINIIVLVYDNSGSMADDISAMIRANQAFYKDFSKFEERGSIAIARADFNEYFEMTAFKDVSAFNTHYSANGGTALFKGISQAKNYTIAYYNELVKRLNVNPRITFLVFSDGQDSWDVEEERLEAINALKELNSLDATTVFVAFREAIHEETGSKLGFTCTRDITSVKELISCLGTELSKSCKEQSQSVYSLKSEFFSKAAQDASEDNLEEQAVIADDFFDNI